MKKSNWIKEKNDYVYINTCVQPRASRNEIVGLHDDTLKVRITSPPVEGAANALLIKFISK